MLNAYCTFRTLLEVSLFQGVKTLLQSNLQHSGVVVRFAFLCVSDASAGDALNPVVVLNYLKLSLSDVLNEASGKFE
jgi:hypothetical protein